MEYEERESAWNPAKKGGRGGVGRFISLDT